MSCSAETVGCLPPSPSPKSYSDLYWKKIKLFLRKKIMEIIEDLWIIEDLDSFGLGRK